MRAHAWQRHATHLAALTRCLHCAFVNQLEYRSLRFEEEYHEPEGGFYQEALQASARGVACGALRSGS